MLLVPQKICYIIYRFIGDFSIFRFISIAFKETEKDTIYIILVSVLPILNTIVLVLVNVWTKSLQFFNAMRKGLSYIAGLSLGAHFFLGSKLLHEKTFDNSGKTIFTAFIGMMLLPFARLYVLNEPITSLFEFFENA